MIIVVVLAGNVFGQIHGNKLWIIEEIIMNIRRKSRWHGWIVVNRLIVLHSISITINACNVPYEDISSENAFKRVFS